MADFNKEVPEVQVLNPERKWLMISALQKAIRFNMPQVAAKMAAGILKLEPWYLSNRFPVIAVEDVGIASVKVVYDVLTFPKKAMTPQVLMGIAAALAEAPKSRILTDLYVLSQYPGDTPSGEVLSAINNDFAGTVRKSVETMDFALMEHISRYFLGLSKAKQAQHLVGIEISPVMQTIHDAVRNYKSVGGIMPLWLLFGDLLAEKYAAMSPVTEDVVREFINSYPAASFDQYTVPGKKAVAYFLKSCTPLKAFFEARPSLKEKAAEMIYLILFRLEGGRVALWSNYEQESEMYKHRLSRGLQALGLSQSDIFPLCEIVMTNLSTLNKARATVY